MTTKRTTFTHFKQQGEWAELLFMARAAEHGLAIARPWGDSAPYDVAIVATNPARSRPDLLRVQVKSTQCQRRHGYKCHVDSNGVPYRPDQLDFIAAYVITVAVWFIIPIQATHGQSELFLTPHHPPPPNTPSTKKPGTSSAAKFDCVGRTLLSDAVDLGSPTCGQPPLVCTCYHRHRKPALKAAEGFSSSQLGNSSALASRKNIDFVR